MHLDVQPQDPAQPAKGLLRVWSGPDQAFVLENATEDQVVAYFRKAGADRAESLARRLVAIARRSSPKAPDQLEAKVAPRAAPKRRP